MTLSYDLKEEQFSRFAGFVRGYTLAYLLVFILTVALFISRICTPR